MALEVIDTIFDAAKLFVPDVYEDDRGFFKEIYTTRRYKEAGVTDTFLQDSVSFSTKNVIRGLHYDFEMSKFVQALRGRVWDVIVDLRQVRRHIASGKASTFRNTTTSNSTCPPASHTGSSLLATMWFFCTNRARFTIRHASGRSAGTTRLWQSNGLSSVTRVYRKRTAKRPSSRGRSL